MSEQPYAGTLARIADAQQQILAALDRIERNQHDPEEIRQAVADITASYVLITQMAELASVQRTQILEIVTWMRERITGEEQKRMLGHAENLAFLTNQIAPILQGVRDDLVLLRSDVRELRSAIELAGGQMPASGGEAAETPHP